MYNIYYEYILPSGFWAWTRCTIDNVLTISANNKPRWPSILKDEATKEGSYVYELTQRNDRVMVCSTSWNVAAEKEKHMNG